MPIYAWVLLAFAVWTLLVLFFSIGIYRWSLILTGRKRAEDFPADRVEGPDWYRRAMRAHANCVENLPVYGAIVVCALALGIRSELMDGLALTVLGARIGQSLVHLLVPQRGAVVLARFAFFFAQALCILVMAWLVAEAGLTHST